MNTNTSIAPNEELIYEEITRRAAKLNIPVAHLFKMIGKNANIMQRWKDKNPLSISIYKQIDAKLNELETSKPVSK